MINTERSGSSVGAGTLPISPGEETDEGESEDSFQDLFVTNIIPQKTFAVRHTAGMSPVPGTRPSIKSTAFLHLLHFLVIILAKFRDLLCFIYTC